MPNWVTTDYVFYSTNKDDVKNFHKLLKLWIDTKPLKKEAWNGSSRWLGNILLHCGFNYQKIIKGQYGRCRGEITSIDPKIYEVKADDKQLYCLRLTTRTANKVMPALWLNVFRKFYYNNEYLKFAYLSTDHANQYCERYDTQDILSYFGILPEEIFLVTKVVKEEIPGFEFLKDAKRTQTMNELKDFLSKLLKREVSEKTICRKLQQTTERAEAKLKKFNAENELKVYPISTLTKLRINKIGYSKAVEKLT